MSSATCVLINYSKQKLVNHEQCNIVILEAEKLI